jgi:hypothetical protein
MRVLPILLVFAAMFYWLWRARPPGVASAPPARFDPARDSREVNAAIARSSTSNC